ncbi:NUDIX hydrolase [Leifsonia sp. C5G2]|uniref:NUDIX hydrolase n=1 Tax=Leifsonia sp. C5G2 TaxID=2735269 RepID=UPI00158482BB|nr:NUDIX hydrolase [Leifsonia sp. C5G2]
MSPAIYAAGALCWRVVDDRIVVLVVHRTKYGDVTIPKGKVDPGETLPQTAVREILEETGLAIGLGVPLGVSTYALGSGREKIVHFWAAEVSDKAIERSTFVPNSEIAAIEWVTIKKARGYLTYERDVEILEAFDALVRQGITSTFALIALRHGKAAPRDNWGGSDAARPLTERGVRQAAADVPTLQSWRPKRIVTSDAVRCVTTVAPLAAATGIKPSRDHGISQDAYEEGAGDVRRVVGKRIRSRKTAVLCSHGPVLPEIMREIALATGTMPGGYLNDAADLDTGGFSVVHLSATNPASGIVSIETYPPAG